jgi:hypothetical protein
MPVGKRATRLLQLTVQQTRFLGETVRIFETAMPEQFAWSESTRATEVHFLIDLLEARGWVGVGRQMGATDLTVLAEGYDRLDEINRHNSSQSQGFIAMWFDISLDEARDDGIAAGIVDAGYEPMRIDMKSHNNKIDDEIVAEIRRSRFVVADFYTRQLRTPRRGLLRGWLCAWLRTSGDLHDPEGHDRTCSF